MIITAQIANKSGFDIVGNHAQVYIKPKTPRKNMRAANACAARIRSKGVRKVLYSKEFPYREIFASHGLFPYSEMNLLRAVAAQAAVAALASLERPAERASVCLAAERYMPQLENAAVRLYPLVKNIFFCLPRGGEELCAAMLSGYGVAAQNFPVPPKCDLVVEFSPLVSAVTDTPTLRLHGDTPPETDIIISGGIQAPEDFEALSYAAYLSARGKIRPEDVSVRKIKFTW